MKTMHKMILAGVICLFIAPLGILAQTIEKEIKVASFSELEIKTVGNVYLIQGNKESVRVESDKDVSDYIATNTSGNKLTITTKGIRNWSGKLNIYVTYRNLGSISINAAGNIRSDNTMKTNTLSLQFNATGNINLDIQCEKLTGNFSAVGNIKLSGKANETMLKCTGTGNINAGEFVAADLSVSLKGVGNVTVNASKEISIDASGTGNITYKGKPAVKYLSKHGTGSVKPE